MLSDAISELCDLLVFGLFEGQHEPLHLVADLLLLGLQVFQLPFLAQVLSLFVLVYGLLLLVGILGLLEACLDPLDVLLQSMDFLGILLRLQEQGLMLLELLLLLLDIDLGLGLLAWLMRAEESAQEPRLLLLGLLRCHLGWRLYHLALDGVR